MEGDVLAFGQVMTVIVLSTAAFVGIFFGARALWLLGSRTKSRPLAAPDDSRFERLENAVDAIAIEVERISEAQRFAVGLLAERLPPRPDRVDQLAAPGAGKRINTPH